MAIALLVIGGIVAVRSTPTPARAPGPAAVVINAGDEGQLAEPAYVFASANAFFRWGDAMIKSKNLRPAPRQELIDSARLMSVECYPNPGTRVRVLQRTPEALLQVLVLEGGVSGCRGFTPVRWFQPRR